MKQEDKLRFELGVSFDKLTPHELSRNESIYNDIYDRNVIKYGYDGDSPYYDTVSEYAEYLLEAYKDDHEKLVESIIQGYLTDMFGWSLSVINEDIRPYAEKRFINILTEDGFDADFIGEILADSSLPS